MELLDWDEFALRRPGLADLGKRMLWGNGDGKVAWLATHGYRAAHIAPVCPIFAGNGLYLLVDLASPKMRDLLWNGRYALHAQLGGNDLEFQVSGYARVILRPSERDPVMAAIPFKHYDPDDGVYELYIRRALSVSWDEPGKPRRVSWRAG